LPASVEESSFYGMIESEKSDRERRLALARQAFKEFFAQCFWSWNEDTEITNETIPLIIEGLRHYGGHRGYRIAAELCQ
jgi:hypothetical protein